MEEIVIEPSPNAVTIAGIPSLDARAAVPAELGSAAGRTPVGSGSSA